MLSTHLKTRSVPVSEVHLDWLNVILIGASGSDAVTGTVHKAWNRLRERPVVQKKFRQLQQRFEGTHLIPEMVFLHTAIIPKKLRALLETREDTGAPIVYVVHHGAVNAPDIRSRFKVENADFYVSPNKRFSFNDFENALSVVMELGETVAIPADDDRIRDEVAAGISELDLENPKTGRLDAVKIAQVYGITPSAFAQVIGVSRQSLLKTPHSPHRQQLLRPFAKLSRLGVRLVGTVERFRGWLNEPNPELYQQATPLDLIRRGQVADALALVEDQLLGNPA